MQMALKRTRIYENIRKRNANLNRYHLLPIRLGRIQLTQYTVIARPLKKYKTGTLKSINSYGWNLLITSKSK